jgi:hypothetical protein
LLELRHGKRCFYLEYGQHLENGGTDHIHYSCF